MTEFEHEPPEEETDLEAADDWSVGEIERAYQQALEASEAVGLELPDLTAELDAPLETYESEEEAEADCIADAAEEEVVEEQVTPLEVIESLLFVGGDGLTVKKMSSILRQESKSETVENILEKLNERYHTEGRPYEIQLAEGGYHLRLRSDFERIRNRVYGLSPKEIRLSQEAMEVLAFVAYQQPVNKKQVEETGRSNGMNLLRQLVRRELIAIERNEEKKADVQYVTTARFLQLFGLGNLKDLPRREQIAMK